MGLDISIDFIGFGGDGDISNICTKDNIVTYEKLAPLIHLLKKIS